MASAPWLPEVCSQWEQVRDKELRAQWSLLDPIWQPDSSSRVVVVVSVAPVRQSVSVAPAMPELPDACDVRSRFLEASP